LFYLSKQLTLVVPFMVLIDSLPLVSVLIFIISFHLVIWHFFYSCLSKALSCNIRQFLMLGLMALNFPFRTICYFPKVLYVVLSFHLILAVFIIPGFFNYALIFQMNMVQSMFVYFLLLFVFNFILL
jgi:hypothetical protein